MGLLILLSSISTIGSSSYVNLSTPPAYNIWLCGKSNNIFGLLISEVSKSTLGSSFALRVFRFETFIF
jgi:hypothetical protein